MNVYSPRQRETSGRWDFTVKNGAGIMPLGYCHAYHVWTAEDLKYYDASSAQKEADRLNAQYAPFELKFHGGGHTTAEEAVQCYREYLLDHQLRFSEKPDDDTQHRCAVPECGAWTQHTGWLTGDHNHFWHLCPDHQNRESVEKLFKGISQAWGS